MTDHPVTAATPLEMAQLWARRVFDIADHYARRDDIDPGMGQVEAHVHGAGRQQFEAAQMAAFMAVVSIAEDLREIRGLLDNTAVYDTVRAADSIAADIHTITQMLTRGEQAADWATREHMRRWGSGTETHEGEATDDQ